MDKTILEAIGYVGTALVLVSFLMTSVYKLRVINTIGSLISMIYGLLVPVYPTVVLNGALALINIFFLWRHLSSRSEKIYSATKAEAADPIVRAFLEKYKEEIYEFFPTFDIVSADVNTAYVIMCEDTLAGVCLGKFKDNREFDVYLDFVTKAFRDFSVGKFFYRELEQENITKCRFLADIPKSYVYLRKVGYKRNGDVMELILKK